MSRGLSDKTGVVTDPANPTQQQQQQQQRGHTGSQASQLPELLQGVAWTKEEQDWLGAELHQTLRGRECEARGSYPLPCLWTCLLSLLIE